MSSAMVPYNYQAALEKARSRAAEATASVRSRFNARSVEMGIGATKTVGEVVLSSATVSFMSARYGGPSGLKVKGISVEVIGAIICGALAATGYAGRYTEDVIALGLGSASAYAARLGFEQGLKRMAPSTVKKIAEGKVAGFIGADPGWVGAGPLNAAEAELDALAAA